MTERQWRPGAGAEGMTEEKAGKAQGPEELPAKQQKEAGALMRWTKEQQKVIDATQGRRTKSVIIMETDQIVLSAIQPDTIARRFAASHLPEEWKGEVA